MSNYSDKKLLKYIIIASVAATAGILIRELAFPKIDDTPLMEPDVFKDIKIDFTLLESKSLGALLQFEEVSLTPGQKNPGRADPFAPF